MGERCEKRGSTRDTIVIAVSSTVAVFAVMLVITLVSVYCTRKKYHQETSSKTANMTLENVSWLSYLVIQNLLMELYKDKLGLFIYPKKKKISLLPMLGTTALRLWVLVMFTIKQRVLNWDPWRVLQGILLSFWNCTQNFVWLCNFLGWESVTLLKGTTDFAYTFQPSWLRGEATCKCHHSKGWAQACRKGVLGTFGAFALKKFPNDSGFMCGN